MRFVDTCCSRGRATLPANLWYVNEPRGAVKTMASSTGIEARHRKACASRDGGKCDCTPSYQAQIYNKHTRRTVKKTFTTKAAAKSWRREMYIALEKGTHRAPSKKTVREAGEELVAGMKDGSILAAGGRRYRSGPVINYERALRLRIYPALGGYRLTDLDRPAVQRFVDQLVEDGHTAEVIVAAMNPLKVIYRRATRRGEFYGADPTKGLEMPRQLGVRDRIANEHEAAELIAAVPELDQGIWACAFYAGLRLGEIQALTWDRVDTDGPTAFLTIDRGWDNTTAEGGFGDVKTASSRRRVPVLDVLRPFLEKQWQRLGGGGFVFPREYPVARGPKAGISWPDGPELLEMVRHDGYAETGRRLGASTRTVWAHAKRVREGRSMKIDRSQPFNRRSLSDRAEQAWKERGLEPITLHECRHTFASMAVYRGVNPVQVQHWLGHANVQTTLAVYTHLVPDSEPAAIERMNEPVLLRAITGGRAQLPPARQSRDSSSA